MSRPRDRSGSPREGVPGPIEPGTALYRLLKMVAEEIARSQAQGIPETTALPGANGSRPERPAGEDHTSFTDPPPTG